MPNPATGTAFGSRSGHDRYDAVMLELGLTGGIGSGKSTAAEMLVAHGARLIDADVIVRDLQAPGTPVVRAMAERFGDHILRDDGSLDRQAVADIVFADADELAALNAIVHPAVGVEMTKRREQYAATDDTVILDIPLLVRERYQALAAVIVVDCPVEVAVQRLIDFRQFNEADARARIASQISRDERKAEAEFVIDNGSDIEHLIGEVDRCWKWIASLDRPEPGAPVVPFGR